MAREHMEMPVDDADLGLSFYEATEDAISHCS